MLKRASLKTKSQKDKVNTLLTGTKVLLNNQMENLDKDKPSADEQLKNELRGQISSFLENV